MPFFAFCSTRFSVEIGTGMDGVRFALTFVCLCLLNRIYVCICIERCAAQFRREHEVRTFHMVFGRNERRQAASVAMSVFATVIEYGENSQRICTTRLERWVCSDIRRISNRRAEIMIRFFLRFVMALKLLNYVVIKYPKVENQRIWFMVFFSSHNLCILLAKNSNTRIIYSAPNIRI